MSDDVTTIFNVLYLLGGLHTQLSRLLSDSFLGENKTSFDDNNFAFEHAGQVVLLVWSRSSPQNVSLDRFILCKK